MPAARSLQTPPPTDQFPHPRSSAILDHLEELPSWLAEIVRHCLESPQPDCFVSLDEDSAADKHKNVLQMLYLVSDYAPELARELQGWIEDVQYKIAQLNEPVRSPREKVRLALEIRSMSVRQIVATTDLDEKQVHNVLAHFQKEKQVGSRRTALDPLSPGQPEKFYFLFKQ
jgi:hypothetical protein